MDLKSFAFGAVVGGVVVAGVSALLSGRQRDNGTEDRDPPGQATSMEAGESGLVRPESPPSTQGESPPPSRTETPSVIQELPTATVPETVEQDWLAARRAKLMEEPKDMSWSYYMERAVHQFLSGHSAMSQFGVAYIECRTTTCQIAVEAYTESAAPDWQRVMYDMRQQPWYEFGQVGTSGGESGGRRMTLTELQRIPNE